VPGKSGGDVACGGCGEQDGVRSDANAAEVKAVGVQADGEGGFGLGSCAVMDLAGGDEKIHAGVVELVVPGLAEFEGELRTALAVLWIPVFVFPAGVMEQRKKPDDLLVGHMMPAEIEAVSQHRAPVAGAMVGMGAEAEPGGDKLPERKFWKR